MSTLLSNIWHRESLLALLHHCSHCFVIVDIAESLLTLLKLFLTLLSQHVDTTKSLLKHRKFLKLLSAQFTDKRLLKPKRTLSEPCYILPLRSIRFLLEWVSYSTLNLNPKGPWHDNIHICIFYVQCGHETIYINGKKWKDSIPSSSCSMGYNIFVRQFFKESDTEGKER